MRLWNKQKILVFVSSWRRSRVTLTDKIFKPIYNKSNAYNPTSEKSKKMIQDIGNVELFELCETIPKVQCSECLLYWNQGIVYCTCRHLLRENQSSRGILRWTWIFPPPHGNRHGETEEQIKDHNLRRRCIKRGFEGIHDRFQNDPTFRESPRSINRKSQNEYFRYKKSWWISLNISGRNEPMKLRSDFNEAFTQLHRLHRASGEERLAPIPSWQYQKWHPSSSSSSTFWWQWNDSWWTSSKFFKKSSTSELVKEQHIERSDPLCGFFTKLLRSDTFQDFFCCSQDRLQLIAICCNRRCVWTAHLTRHTFSLNDTHMRGSSRMFGVRTSHSMCHLHALMLCVRFSSTSPFCSPCCPSSLLSSCRSSWPSTSSSTMWWTNSQCTAANEHFGTLAEYDPITDAESVYTQVKLKVASRFLRIPKSECPDVWRRLPRHKWPKTWSNIEDPLVLLERNLYGHPLAGLLWERPFEEVLVELGREKVPNWECLSVHRKTRTILIGIRGWYQNGWKEPENGSHSKKLMRNVDLDEPESFLDHVFLGCTQIECKPNEIIVEQHTKMFETRFCWSNWKTTRVGKTSRNPMSLRESFRVRLDFFWIWNTIHFVSFSCPFDVVEHWHEENSLSKFSGSMFRSCKSFWILCYDVNPGKIFNSNSIGSPSIPGNAS